MKTNRAAAKRFKRTGTGRFKQKKAGLRHGMINKNRKHLRRLRKADLVDPVDERKLRTLLPYE